MKNILLAISGLTPQIVTETLYALSVQKGIEIDEIFVVTTKKGKIVLEGKDKNPRTPNVSLSSQIKALSEKFKIKAPGFSVKKNVIVAEEESRELYDIKTDKENKLFPNKLSELIKELAFRKDTAIHATLSGGRKSMSAHLALTMSLFARSQDRLYHVITDEKFEFKNFFPQSAEEEKALVLAEVPFVKLRSLNAPLLKAKWSYSQIVEKTQRRLKFLTDENKLIIGVAERKVFYVGKSVRFEPLEIAIYLKFAERKISRGAGYKISEIQYDANFAEELKSFLTSYYNHYFDPKDNKKQWYNLGGMPPELFRTKRSKINAKLKDLFDDEETFEEFAISKKGPYGVSEYFIKAPKEKIGINYE